jgi:hypothetical protein
MSFFGNKQFQEKLKNEFDIDRAFNISDQALAKIFFQCKLTICPQKWEMFGYVIAESISCGTPVLAFTLMSPAEHQSNDEKEFLRKIKGFDFAKTKENKEKKYYPWDMAYSDKELNDTIWAAGGALMQIDTHLWPSDNTNKNSGGSEADVVKLLSESGHEVNMLYKTETSRPCHIYAKS